MTPAAETGLAPTAADGRRPSEPHPPHRVVVIGCGFGGLFAVRALRRAPVEITVIDRTNHHLFQPLLYQVATGILSEGEIAPAIRDVLRRYDNVRVELGEVTEIDLAARTVTANQRGRQLVTSYDSLIVATGAQTSYFGRDELAHWATGMKSIDDALALRGQIFGAFEAAESEDDPEIRRDWLTFAVIGGGPTGVEMAGQIAELSRRALHRNFRTIDPRETRVLLFEGADSLISSFGPRLSDTARRGLERLGVEVVTEAMVTQMDAEGLVVRRRDGAHDRFDARTKIWTAGVTATPLGRQLAEATGASLDRAGRVVVEPDCTLPGHPEVFVVGDLAVIEGVPGMAEGAMQAGAHAARTVRRRLAGDRRRRPFHYRDLGSLATISRFQAVAKFGPIEVGGFLGWWLWLAVHLVFLTGFKNRFGTVGRWAVSFVGRGRLERTLTRRQLLALPSDVSSAARGQQSQ